MFHEREGRENNLTLYCVETGLKENPTKPMKTFELHAIEYTYKRKEVQAHEPLPFDKKLKSKCSYAI